MGHIISESRLVQMVIAVCITIAALGMGVIITQCIKQEDENIIKLREACINNGGTIIGSYSRTNFHCIIIKGQNEGKVRSVHPMGG